MRTLFGTYFYYILINNEIFLGNGFCQILTGRVLKKIKELMQEIGTIFSYKILFS